MKVRIPRWIWVLFALLGASFGMIFLGEQDKRSNPDSDSFGPSGMRAWKELLLANGYEVRTERALSRSFKSTELVIAVFVNSRVPELSSPEFAAESDVESVLSNHCKAGGNLLAVALESDFHKMAVESEGRQVTLRPAISGQPSRAITERGNTSSWTRGSGLAYQTHDMALWYEGEDPFVWADLVGDGTMTVVESGIGATNHFLDQGQNAQFFLDVVALAADNGKHVVFFDAAHNGGAQPALVEVIGPWTSGAWWQLNFLFLVLLATLGVRFGFPDRIRRAQVGGKEFSVAIANLFSRSRSDQMTLHIILQNADHEIRRRLKLAGDTPKDVRDRAMPDELAQAVLSAENALHSDPPHSVMVSVARMLDYELSKFLAHSDRRPAARKRKRS